jgi:hypothetical protein
VKSFTPEVVRHAASARAVMCDWIRDVDRSREV